MSSALTVAGKKKRVTRRVYLGSDGHKYRSTRRTVTKLGRRRTLFVRAVVGAGKTSRGRVYKFVVYGRIGGKTHYTRVKVGGKRAAKRSTKSHTKRHTKKKTVRKSGFGCGMYGFGGAGFGNHGRPMILQQMWERYPSVATPAPAAIAAPSAGFGRSGRFGGQGRDRLLAQTSSPLGFGRPFRYGRAAGAFGRARYGRR